MNDELLQAVQDYVEEHIGSFHEKRLDTVRNKRLNDILKRKNPYLFKAKAQDATQLVRSILDAFMSSQEETLFGDFLEDVGVFVAQHVYSGYKPTTQNLTGIDLVLEKNGNVYIFEIKSGPNWGNASQKIKMYQNFSEAISRLQPQYPNQKIVPINGCMYGIDRSPKKTGEIKESGRIIKEVVYWKLCGQDFWYFISNNRELYLEIIEPLGYQAKQRNGAFQNEYDKFINKSTNDFLNNYLGEDGGVAWDLLTRFKSESSAEDIVAHVAGN